MGRAALFAFAMAAGGCVPSTPPAPAPGAPPPVAPAEADAGTVQASPTPTPIAAQPDRQPAPIPTYGGPPPPFRDGDLRRPPRLGSTRYAPRYGGPPPPNEADWA